MAEQVITHNCPNCGKEIPNGLWNWSQHDKTCDYSIKKPKPYSNTTQATFLGSKEVIESIENACKEYIENERKKPPSDT